MDCSAYAPTLGGKTSNRSLQVRASVMLEDREATHIAEGGDLSLPLGNEATRAPEKSRHAHRRILVGRLIALSKKFFSSLLG
jgi:hypothetical protein